MSGLDEQRVRLVRSICPERRFRHAAGRWAAGAWLVIGIPLALSRIILMALIGLIARARGPHPHRFAWGLVLRLNGWRMTWHGRETYDQASAAGPVVVAYNHVCLADGPAMLMLPHSQTIAGTGRTHGRRIDGWLMRFVAGCFRFPVVTTDSPRRLLRSLDAWRVTPGAPSLLVAPEGTIASDRGLFRFERLVFSLDVPVLPVVIRVRAPFGINLYPLSGNMGLNFLWLLMLPWLRMDLTCLPVQRIAPGEAPQAFADRTQRLIANELGAMATTLTRRDKAAARAAAGERPEARLRPTHPAPAIGTNDAVPAR